MASLSGNVMHVYRAPPGFTIVCPIFSLLAVRFVLSAVLRVPFVVPIGFVTVSTLPPLFHSPVPLPSALPSPPPRRSPHLSLDLSLVLSPILHGTVSFLISQASLPPRTHTYSIFSHTRIVHFGPHVAFVERFSLTTPSSLFVVVRPACTPFISRGYDKNRLSIILGCKVKSLVHY